MRKNTLRCLAAALLLLGSSASIQAKIDLVTLPARDQTELTIYNSVDLTLARESRTLSFTKGSNQIQFSWANTLIDPTSLQIDLANTPGLTVVDAVYPANTRDLVVWNIEADAAVSAPVTIRYFTSGLSWRADYVLKSNAAETELELRQTIHVDNQSGEDFEQAVTRVVVGEINLVQMIADLARLGMVDAKKDEGAARNVAKARMQMQELSMDAFAMAPSAGAAGRAEAKEIVKKAVSEYQLYRVEGEEDIRNGWGKDLPTPPIASIPYDLSYEIDASRFGPEPIRLIKFKNDDAHKLGKEPLPAGSFYVYTDDGRQGLRFDGSSSHKYIPVGEDVELNLGNDGLLMYEERVISSARAEFEYDNSGNVSGWDEIRTVELELRNTRDRKVPVKLTHPIYGDWEFQTVSDQTHKRVDQNTVRWELTLEPREKRIIRYTVVVANGARANR